VVKNQKQTNKKNQKKRGGGDFFVIFFEVTQRVVKVAHQLVLK
jgi:hypothetical protein